MGWNTVEWTRRTPVHAPTSRADTRFYFVHSYAPDVIRRTTHRRHGARPPVRGGRRAATTCSRRSSTPRSPGDAGTAALRGVRAGGVGGVIVIPADRPARRTLRPAVPRRPRAPRPSTRPTRSRSPSGSRTDGARRLHVVDLDAALEHGSNRDIVKDICRSVAIPVQLGGGIRSLEAIERGARRTERPARSSGPRRRLDPGVRREAVEAVRRRDRRGASTSQDGDVMTRGWQRRGPRLEDAIAALNDAGAPRFLVTSIARDGTMDGPDLALYERVSDAHRRGRSSRAAASATPTTSGRFASSACEAVVVGKALYARHAAARQESVRRVMLAKRVIPCLDVDAGRVVKGTRFVDLRDAGDPVELAARYDARGRRRAGVPRHHRDASRDGRRRST